MSTDDLIITATAIACYTKLKSERKKSKNRSKWVKSWLKKRSLYSHVNLLQDLRLEPDGEIIYVWMRTHILNF